MIIGTYKFGSRAGGVQHAESDHDIGQIVYTHPSELYVLGKNKALPSIVNHTKVGGVYDIEEAPLIRFLQQCVTPKVTTHAKVVTLVSDHIDVERLWGIVDTNFNWKSYLYSTAAYIDNLTTSHTQKKWIQAEYALGLVRQQHIAQTFCIDPNYKTFDHAPFIRAALANESVDLDVIFAELGVAVSILRMTADNESGCSDEQTISQMAEFTHEIASKL